MQVETGPTAKTLSRDDIEKAAGDSRAERPSWVRLVRRGVIGIIGTIFFMNGWVTGAFALLGVAALWENWLQFHPWLGAAIALIAVGIVLLLPDDQPQREEPYPRQKDNENELRDAYRITVTPKHRVPGWD